MPFRCVTLTAVRSLPEAHKIAHALAAPCLNPGSNNRTSAWVHLQPARCLQQRLWELATKGLLEAQRHSFTRRCSRPAGATVTVTLTTGALSPAAFFPLLDPGNHGDLLLDRRMRTSSRGPLQHLHRSSDLPVHPVYRNHRSSDLPTRPASRDHRSSGLLTRLPSRNHRSSGSLICLVYRNHRSSGLPTRLVYRNHRRSDPQVRLAHSPQRPHTRRRHHISNSCARRSS